MIALMGIDRSAFQAREVRFVLPLDLLKAYKELFRSLREPPIGAQLRHELGLPRHLTSSTTARPFHVVVTNQNPCRPHPFA